MDDRADQTVILQVTPGTVFDERWRIESILGQGAMGSVFKGTDLRFERPVAVKILAPEHARKAKVLARFEREAELMTSLRHPNIVQLLAHGRRAALPFIVMEYLEGCTLADVLTKSGGTVPVAETAAIARHVAAGLAFLHQHDLVHRDIKPQNIFTVLGGRVVILDLGVVRDQSNPGLTKPGAMVGTPYYMSPEQILGLDDVDHLTDVYALAAVCFELLTGRPPYTGKTNFEVLYGHRNTEVPDAAALVKTVPKRVAAVVARGLAKSRSERPPSAVAFVDELAEAAGDKRVDLVKSFPFLKKKYVETPEARTHLMAGLNDDDGPSMPRTEFVAAMASKATTGEAPDDSADVAPAPPPSAPPVMKASTGRTGFLQVVVTGRGRPVNAAIIVDGRFMGSGSKVLKVADGSHELRLECSGYRPVDAAIDVDPGGTTTVTVDLEPKG